MNLETMEKLEKAATSGPWITNHVTGDCGRWENPDSRLNLNALSSWSVGPQTRSRQAARWDSEFISASRSFVPWAIERIRVLEEDRRVLEDKVHMLLRGKE